MLTVEQVLVTLSFALGVGYFTAWSFSFYPQIFLNYRRKSVVGLSFDFQVYNLIGFFYYSIYSWINYLEWEKEPKHVDISDLAFPVHAFLITSFTCLQIVLYDRGNQKVSYLCWILAFIFITSPILTLYTNFTLSHVLGSVKLFISFIKYMPQIKLNFKRKSTKGFNISNIILDMTGSTLSFAQMTVDAVIEGNYSVFRNFTKLGLSLQSVCMGCELIVGIF
ncbi:hypothetical protein P9112_008929 [Eukaryota sp. TZLM1-RC]